MAVVKVDGSAAALGEVGLDFATNAAAEGHDAPAAAYFVLTRPVSSQWTGLITVFLFPFGLPCRAVKGESMMSSDSGYWSWLG